MPLRPSAFLGRGPEASALPSRSGRPLGPGRAGRRGAHLAPSAGLPLLTLPRPMMTLLAHFAPLSSARTWSCVPALVAGSVPTPKRRQVSTALRALELAQVLWCQNFHRVANRAVWSPLAASRILLSLVVASFVPAGPLVAALDDTLEGPGGATRRCSARWSPACWQPARALLARADASFGSRSGSGAGIGHHAPRLARTSPCRTHGTQSRGRSRLSCAVAHLQLSRAIAQDTMRVYFGAKARFPGKYDVLQVGHSVSGLVEYETYRHFVEHGLKIGTYG